MARAQASRTPSAGRSPGRRARPGAGPGAGNGSGASLSLGPRELYRALSSRDARFDGRFFVGVVTTGVYCRPVCPAPTPSARNVRFFACAAGAEEHGFRPCRRCRPETVPGTPAWLGSSATVTRALRLIGSGSLDHAGVERLAERVGVGSRHLRRLFAEHLGASPLAVARTRRVHFARRLIDETRLPMSEVALAAGYSSLRQFNHSIRACFGRPPTQLRREARGGRTCAGQGGLALRLSYRPPLAWQALLGYLAVRAIPGVERVDGDRYERSVEIDGAPGLIQVSGVPDGPQLLLRLHTSSSSGLLPVVDRVRRLFDLGADPLHIARHLGRDAALARRIETRPGIRVPGAWDPFELAVRAVLGQQVTVKGATTLAGRIAQRFGRPIEAGTAGSPTRLFPAAEVLAEADLQGVGLPRARAETIRRLAEAVATGALDLDGPGDLEAAIERLTRIPGIGAWTAHYVAMRALNEPDAFPAGDLGLRRAVAEGAAPVTPSALARRAESWRPWRAYGAMWLWTTAATPAP